MKISGNFSENLGISLKISYFLSRSHKIYENLRLSELISFLYFYMSFWSTQKILNFKNEYSKISMENQIYR